jgi:photosystem II stability/assembly factor-like uncharacterized protein
VPQEVFESHDAGRSWRLLVNDFQTDIEGAPPDRLVAFDPRNPQMGYGFGFDGVNDFFTKSDDGGRRWSAVSFCPGCNLSLTALALDPVKPSTVFLGGAIYQGCCLGENLGRSDDGGKTWSVLAAPDQLYVIAIARTRTNVLYGLSCSGLYKSQDSGATWNAVGRGLPVSQLCVPMADAHARAASASYPGQPTLALDPQLPGIMYVGTLGAGVFRSRDDGATFRPFGHGLESATIAALAVDPTNSLNIFAGVAGQGVWRWNAGSGQWTLLDAGFPVGDFSGVLALDPQHPTDLYAGTGRHGVFRLTSAATPALLDEGSPRAAESKP